MIVRASSSASDQRSCAARKLARAINAAVFARRLAEREGELPIGLIVLALRQELARELDAQAEVGRIVVEGAPDRFIAELRLAVCHIGAREHDRRRLRIRAVAKDAAQIGNRRG